jgi:hypothetical protein
MKNSKAITKIPYETPGVMVVVLSLEQDIATGSSNGMLTDMDTVEIYDDPFTSLSLF